MASAETKIKISIKCPQCGRPVPCTLEDAAPDTLRGTCAECGHTFSKMVPHLRERIEQRIAAATQEWAAAHGADAGAAASATGESMSTTAPRSTVASALSGPWNGARRAAAINVTAVMIGALAAVPNLPFAAAIFLCLLVQVASLQAILRSKGAISLLTSPSSMRARPQVPMAFLVPPAAIALQGAGIKIENYADLWLPVGVLSVALMVLIFRLGWNRRDDIRLFAVLVPFIALEAFGLISIINAAFDNSEPHYYDVTVLDKRDYHGNKSPQHILTVSAWGNRVDSSDVHVKQRFYHRVKINDRIEILEHEGSLHVPWYEVLPAGTGLRSY